MTVKCEYIEDINPYSGAEKCLIVKMKNVNLEAFVMHNDIEAILDNLSYEEIARYLEIRKED